jgi:hypothetical protein
MITLIITWLHDDEAHSKIQIQIPGLLRAQVPCIQDDGKAAATAGAMLV